MRLRTFCPLFWRVPGRNCQRRLTTPVASRTDVIGKTCRGVTGSLPDRGSGGAGGRRRSARGDLQAGSAAGLPPCWSDTMLLENIFVHLILPSCVNHPRCAANNDTRVPPGFRLAPDGWVGQAGRSSCGSAGKLGKTPVKLRGTKLSGTAAVLSSRQHRRHGLVQHAALVTEGQGAT
ncbi:Hypp7868 [Branchiostoma lanceolatum]|uniref:Hypp7868 protein n=1 Tax=Branchiostoma lanceolatum TaxID=7740 RepID=A0A8J9Z4R0_BRALA|nr:Hypp7868 [Branchiostoma lanceolatum]